MSIGLILIVATLWFIMSVKTLAFALTDLADGRPDRLTILSYSFVGLVWPLTYVVLSLILIFGVNSQSIGTSILKIREAWKRK